MTNLDKNSIQEIISSIKYPDPKPNEIEMLPFRTTNTLYRYKDLILKKIKEKRSFESELCVYENKNKFRFRMPDLINYYIDSNNDYWVTLSFVPSVGLPTFLDENPHMAKPFALEFAQVIAEFEITSVSLPYLGIMKWAMNESLDPLYTLLEPFVPNELIEDLRHSIILADRIVSEFNYYPCFDSFKNNILVHQSASGCKNVQYYFCDFDKAYRSVPIGEQLSHYSVSEHLNPFLGDAIHVYANIISKKDSEVLRVLRLTTLARALSGLRDSIKWKGNLGTVFEADYRHVVAKRCLLFAFGSLEDFVSEISLNRNLRVNLRRLLSLIEEHLDQKKL